MLHFGIWVVQGIAHILFLPIFTFKFRQKCSHTKKELTN